MRSRLLVFVVMLAICRAAVCEPSDAESSTEYRAFNDASESGKDAEALVLAEGLRDKFPKSAIGWRSIGDAHIALRNWDQAVDAFRRAIELDPDDPELHLKLGRTLTDMGYSEKGIEPLERAIELESAPAEGHYYLGVAFFNSQEFQKALEPLRRAIELDPEYAWAHKLLGWSMVYLGRPQEAIEPLRRAIELDPEYLSAMFSLAIAYGRAEQIDHCGHWLARWGSLKEPEAENEAVLMKQIRGVLRSWKIEFPVEVPSEKAIREFYQKHPEVFCEAAVHLQMISGPKPDKTQELMEALRKELSAGGNFADAASEHSNDSAAAKGGDRGWVKPGDLREDLEEVAFAMKPGEFSEVLEDETHFRLIYLVERNEGTPPPLTDVREQAVEAIEERARTVRIKEWIEQARKEIAEKAK